MKFIIFLGLLILSSCQPRAAPINLDSAQLKVAIQSGAPHPCNKPENLEGETFAVLCFESGTEDTLNTILTVSGDSLVLNDAKCSRTLFAVSCDIGTVPAGKTYVLPFGGVLRSVRAEFYRPDGSRHEKTN